MAVFPFPFPSPFTPEQMQRLKDVFDGLSYDPETVDEITKMLAEGSQRAGSSRPHHVQADHFGQSHAGGNLGKHAAMASEAIISELGALSEGLAGYEDGIKSWARGIKDADTNNSAAFLSLQRGADNTTNGPIGGRGRKGGRA